MRSHRACMQCWPFNESALSTRETRRNFRTNSTWFLALAFLASLALLLQNETNSAVAPPKGGLGRSSESFLNSSQRPYVRQYGYYGAHGYHYGLLYNHCKKTPYRSSLSPATHTSISTYNPHRTNIPPSSPYSYGAPPENKNRWGTGPNYYSGHLNARSSPFNPCPSTPYSEDDEWTYTAEKDEDIDESPGSASLLRSKVKARMATSDVAYLKDLEERLNTLRQKSWLGPDAEINWAKGPKDKKVMVSFVKGMLNSSNNDYLKALNDKSISLEAAERFFKEAILTNDLDPVKAQDALSVVKAMENYADLWNLHINWHVGRIDDQLTVVLSKWKDGKRNFITMPSGLGQRNVQDVSSLMGRHQNGHDQNEFEDYSINLGVFGPKKNPRDGSLTTIELENNLSCVYDHAAILWDQGTPDELNKRNPFVIKARAAFQKLLGPIDVLNGGIQVKVVVPQESGSEEEGSDSKSEESNARKPGLYIRNIQGLGLSQWSDDHTLFIDQDEIESLTPEKSLTERQSKIQKMLKMDSETDEYFYVHNWKDLTTETYSYLTDNLLSSPKKVPDDVNVGKQSTFKMLARAITVADMQALKNVEKPLDIATIRETKMPPIDALSMLADHLPKPFSRENAKYTVSADGKYILVACKGEKGFWVSGEDFNLCRLNNLIYSKQADKVMRTMSRAQQLHADTNPEIQGKNPLKFQIVRSDLGYDPELWLKQSDDAWSTMGVLLPLGGEDAQLTEALDEIKEFKIVLKDDGEANSELLKQFPKKGTLTIHEASGLLCYSKDSAHVFLNKDHCLKRNKIKQLIKHIIGPKKEDAEAKSGSFYVDLDGLARVYSACPARDGISTQTDDLSILDGSFSSNKIKPLEDGAARPWEAHLGILSSAVQADRLMNESLENPSDLSCLSTVEGGKQITGRTDKKSNKLQEICPGSLYDCKRTLEAKPLKKRQELAANGKLLETLLVEFKPPKIPKKVPKKPIEEPKQIEVSEDPPKVEEESSKSATEVDEPPANLEIPAEPSKPLKQSKPLKLSKPLKPSKLSKPFKPVELPQNSMPPMPRRRREEPQQTDGSDATAELTAQEPDVTVDDNSYSTKTKVLIGGAFAAAAAAAAIGVPMAAFIIRKLQRKSKAKRSNTAVPDSGLASASDSTSTPSSFKRQGRTATKKPTQVVKSTNAEAIAADPSSSEKGSSETNLATAHGTNAENSKLEEDSQNDENSKLEEDSPVSEAGQAVPAA
eukprot:GHVT01031182.1.p1 GENE.GHVT01031182.1~~GHVT01031182.1.p1  ORF type:complete len:1232 (+),score=160.62 GHVT01031182.1:603-4298(+)